MRNILAIALCLLMAACASSPAPATSSPVVIQLDQLPRSDFDVEHLGAVSVAYQMVVQNKSGAPLHLKRVSLKTVGRSPYVLRDTPAELDQTIDAGSDATVTFSLWAYPQTGRSAHEKLVWLDGTADFDGLTVPIHQTLRVPD